MSHQGFRVSVFKLPDAPPGVGTDRPFMAVCQDRLPKYADVGMLAEVPPMFGATEDEATGRMADLIKEMLKRAGVESWKHMSFERIK